MSQSALHLIELLEIGNTAKGAFDRRGKYKSRNQRWFTTKEKHEVTVGLDEDGNAGEPVNAARDALVEFRYKRGGRETKERYRVLGIFCKYYREWFVSSREMIGRGENKPVKELKNLQILVRLVEKLGNVMKEVKLEKGASGVPSMCMLLRCLMRYWGWKLNWKTCRTNTQLVVLVLIK